MKLNGTVLNTAENNLLVYEEEGNEHFLTGKETPLRDDAFELSDEEKIIRIKR